MRSLFGFLFGILFSIVLFGSPVLGFAATSDVVNGNISTSTIVALTNGDRANLSLNTLKYNDTLGKAAQMKADDMASKGYFAHTSPDGKKPWYWFKAAGYLFNYAGENLAVNFSNSMDIERAWMNSPTHKANITNKNYEEIGIGIAHGTYNGAPTTYVVQFFGTEK